MAGVERGDFRPIGSPGQVPTVAAGREGWFMRFADAELRCIARERKGPLWFCAECHDDKRTIRLIGMVRFEAEVQPNSIPVTIGADEELPWPKDGYGEPLRAAARARMNKPPGEDDCTIEV